MAEQQPTAPEPDRAQLDGDRPEPEGEQIVDLPALLSDEFGISRSVARMEIIMGSVEIDGEKVTGDDKLSFPRSQIEGKEVTVVGEVRHYKLTYDPKG